MDEQEVQALAELRELVLVLSSATVKLSAYCDVLIGRDRLVGAGDELANLPIDELDEDTSCTAQPATQANLHSPEVTVTMPVWLADKDNWPSTIMRGQLLRTTDKAVLFAGSAAVQDSANCLRCGRDITHPGSRWCGYGPVCAEKVGIERPGEVTDKMAREVVARAVMVRSRKQGWMPKSQVRVQEVDDA